QEIYKDRQKFSDQVFRVASSDLVNMGISVVSYTLKDVHDEQVAHLAQLGTAGASWGQPGYTLDTPGGIWGELGTAGTQPRPTQDTPGTHLGALGTLLCTPETYLEMSRDKMGTPGTHLGTAGTPGGEPKTHLGYAARSQQAIAAQRGEVALVERAQRVQLQEQEVGRRRQELEATVRKPAEAERYRLERLAEAHR
ncbi:FLOT1 protein, partial [Prunella himalayana]|nr:FLOT1 protein [Prunella himalayana]